MARIERKIRVGVPTQLAYELWSRPEEFPHFVDGVVAVRNKGSGLYLERCFSTAIKEGRGEEVFDEFTKLIYKLVK